MSDKDWALVCAPCAEAGVTVEFRQAKLSAMKIHFDLEHPEIETLAFNTEWRGKGPAPPEREPNRAARRAQARKGRR